MKLRILTFLLIGTLVGMVSDGKPRQPKAPYHCICGDICAKVAPSERCEVERCNGNQVQ